LVSSICILHNINLGIPNLLNSIAHRDRAVGHTEVSSNRALTTNTSSGGSLGSSLAVEDANLKNTSNLLDLARKTTNLPDTAGTSSVKAAVEISLNKQGREGRIDEEEVLIGLQVALLEGGVGADGGVDGAQLGQFSKDAESGDGGDLDRDVLPVGEEAGLKLAGVY
jgi:hypothetical protein